MTTKIRRKKKEIPVGRPSIFFIVALALGVALLVWVAYQAVTHPMTPPKKTGTASALTSARA